MENILNNYRKRRQKGTVLIQKTDNEKFLVETPRFSEIDGTQIENVKEIVNVDYLRHLRGVIQEETAALAVKSAQNESLLAEMDALLADLENL